MICLPSPSIAAATWLPPHHYQSVLRRSSVSYVAFCRRPLPRSNRQRRLLKCWAKSKEGEEGGIVETNDIQETSEVKWASGEGEMECLGTGTDVECVVSITQDEMGAAKKYAARAVDVMPPIQTHPSQLSKDILDLLFLISPFFFWGTSMVVMKGVLPKTGALFVAATRLLPAGALLLAFATYKGRKQPSGFTAWLAIVLFAIVDATFFQGFLAEGLKRTTAGLGSVIIDSQPLTVAVLAAILFGESLGPLGAVGLATGIIGLLLLEVPIQAFEDFVKGYGLHGLSYSIHFLNVSLDGNSRTVWDSGEWWMLLAAQSMAFGTIMVRWVSQYSDPVMATGWHMIIGGIPLLALSIIQQDLAFSGYIKDIQLEDWLALAYTSIFGSALSYGIFFYNATRGNLTRLSSLTFLTPMFAALFGYLFLDEKLTPIQILGAFITLISMYFVNMKATT